MAMRRAALVLPSLRAHGFTCRSAHDCGLLGDCNMMTGQCMCDQGWTSENCTKLDLLPAPWGPERQAYMNNRSSWGGNIIQGPDGMYHLFYSEMARDGLHEYNFNSQASHAVGSSPLGPFTRKSVIRKPMSHNVQPQIGPDGAVYIFMIGGEPGTAEPHGPMMVGRAENIDAEWEWVLPDMLDQSGRSLPADAQVDNPSAIIYNNGTVTLVTRGVKLFTASTWRGPFLQQSEDVLGCGGKNGACWVEDPFLWRSPRGLHMLFHDHAPFKFHKQATAYAFTSDITGRAGWVFSWWEAATAKNIPFDDGTTHTFCSQQRPQLHFSALPEDGVQVGRPLVLFTGAQHGALTELTSECGINNQNSSEYNPYFDYSFTMAQPIREMRSHDIVV